MRLHTDTLTEANVTEAGRKAGVYFEKLEQHGSRSKARSFDVKLLGNSQRRPNSGGYNSNGTYDYAATWDQWGIFLAALYETDPEMTCWAYQDAEDFHFATASRFRSLTLDRSHGDHNFQFSGTAYQNECTKCGAVRRGRAA